MKEDIHLLTQKAMHLLRTLQLNDSTLKSYETRAFRPIINYYKMQGIYEFQESFMNKLETLYQNEFKSGLISVRTLNWRVRGIRIISEVYKTGGYEWGKYSHKKSIILPFSLEYIVNDFVSEIDLSKKRTQNIESIIRRFSKFISDQGILELSAVTPVTVREFMLRISSDRPKSMDDVVPLC